MPDDEHLMFMSDPRRFWELVHTDDPKKRIDGLLNNVDDLVLGEIARYGIYNDAQMIGDLQQFYQMLVMKMEEEHRKRIYRHIAGMVEHISAVSANAFLPFIAEDNSPGIVSTAVIDYVSLAGLTDNDPMSRPRDIIGMIQSGMLKNKGAAFGGLLNLGDPRVCRLLWPLREQCDATAVDVAVKCGTGFLYSATIDFYIDWLEGMEGDLGDDLFGIVASGLVLVKRWNMVDQVFTGDRPFPFVGIRPKAAFKPVPLADYIKRIAPRLYALERTEPPPRVMPHVLMEWGLKPLTDPSEAVVFDDRLQSLAPPAPISVDRVPDGQVVDWKEEWFDGRGVIFVLWGILNPNGPTLYCLGEREVNGNRRVFFRWLYMLGGCTTYAAKSDPERLTYEDVLDGALGINKHLIAIGKPALIPSPPSFLIINKPYEDGLTNITKHLIQDGPAASADWGEELSYVRAFGSDFFARAGCEIRTVYEGEKAKALAEGKPLPDFFRLLEARYGHLAEFRDAIMLKFESSKLTQSLFEEWWSAINRLEHKQSALGTLSAMWNGAISQMSQDVQKGAITFDKVAELLALYHFQYPD